LAKNRKFCLLRFHLALLIGLTSLKFKKNFAVPETKVFQKAEGKDLVILACTVFDWSTRVTDRRTNRQNCDG